MKDPSPSRLLARVWFTTIPATRYTILNNQAVCFTAQMPWFRTRRRSACREDLPAGMHLPRSKSRTLLDLFAQGTDRIQQTMYTALTTIQVALIDTARASAIASPLVFVH